MPGDVFEEDPAEGWTEFPGDPGDIGPEVALIISALALSSGAERLTGVSGKQGVEGSGEGFRIEGGDIIPDVGRGEVSRPLGSDDDLLGVFLDFDPEAGSETGFGQVESHVETASAATQADTVRGAM